MYSLSAITLASDALSTAFDTADELLRAVVLDLGLVQHVRFDLALSGGIEDLLLDLQVDPHGQADLVGDQLLAVAGLGLLELLELLEQGRHHQGLAKAGLDFTADLLGTALVEVPMMFPANEVNEVK